MDFFTVPTLAFGFLYCFFVILRCNVTRNTTAFRIVQQMLEAWPYSSSQILGVRRGREVWQRSGDIRKRDGQPTGTHGFPEPVAERSRRTLGGQLPTGLVTTTNIGRIWGSRKTRRWLGQQRCTLTPDLRFEPFRDSVGYTIVTRSQHRTDQKLPLDQVPISRNLVLRFPFVELTPRAHRSRLPASVPGSRLLLKVFLLNVYPVGHRIPLRLRVPAQLCQGASDTVFCRLVDVLDVLRERSNLRLHLAHDGFDNVLIVKRHIVMFPRVVLEIVEFRTVEEIVCSSLVC